MTFPTLGPRSLASLLALALATGAFLPPPSPVSADGGVRPVPIHGVRCHFKGPSPAPNSSPSKVTIVSIAFTCVARGEPENFLISDAEFFVDGVAREFRREGAAGTDILSVVFPDGLPAGKHTARVRLIGNGSFAWHFTVTSGGAAYSRPTSNELAGLHL